jgi:hypothetical protein
MNRPLNFDGAQDRGRANTQPPSARLIDEPGDGIDDLASAIVPWADLVKWREGEEVFLVEQGGVVRLYDTQTQTTTSFLDLTGGNFAYSAGGETGLLGIAFDPDFASNGYVYVNSTQRNAAVNGGFIYNEITRFRRSTANPATVDAASRQTVIQIPKNINQANHNAGWIGFGNDNMLYITTGDGGSGGDPTANAQNGQSLLGKLLRLDVSDPTISYAIPKDNPFANGNGGANAGFLDEIWATGLRNPFRAGFDRKTGDLYIGDVGQGAWEEVDRALAGVGGLNFGWDLREGANNFDGFNGSTAGLTDPIHQYGRGDGRSVIGGTVFRGGGELDGWYLFSDFYNGGTIWALPVDVDCQAAGANCPPAGQARIVDFTTTVGGLDVISGFSTDENGNLYISDFDGDLFRLAAVPVPLPAAAWLLGSGWLLLMGFRRRR